MKWLGEVCFEADKQMTWLGEVLLNVLMRVQKQMTFNMHVLDFEKNQLHK